MIKVQLLCLHRTPQQSPCSENLVNLPLFLQGTQRVHGCDHAFNFPFSLLAVLLNLCRVQELQVSILLLSRLCSFPKALPSRDK